MVLPFFAGPAVTLELGHWFGAGVCGPLLVKVLVQQIIWVTAACGKGRGGLKLTEAKQRKVALQIAKALLYVASNGLMLPVLHEYFANHYNHDPPTLVKIAGLSSSDTQLYLRYAVAIPYSLYLYELMTTPHPDFMTWLHHCAAAR